MPYGTQPCPECGVGEMERMGSYKNPKGYKCDTCGYEHRYSDEPSEPVPGNDFDETTGARSAYSSGGAVYPSSGRRHTRGADFGLEQDLAGHQPGEEPLSGDYYIDAIDRVVNPLTDDYKSGKNSKRRRDY